MTTFGEYANEMYLGCTPFLALEFLEKHANARSVRNWDARELENKLTRGGLGMLLLAGEEANVIQVPKRHTAQKRKLEELFATLKAMRSL